VTGEANRGKVNPSGAADGNESTLAITLIRKIANEWGTRRPNSTLCSLGNQNGLVFLVRAFEVGDLMIVLEVPDPGCDLVDQIVIVRYQ
jgi:hypothetical protein